MRRVTIPPKAVDFAKQSPSVTDWLYTVWERLGVYEGVSDPVLSEVPENQWIMYRNTTTGELRMWVNDNGTLKKSAALT